MGDESETWDELMGPSSDQLKNMLRMDDPPVGHNQVEPPGPVVRSSSRARGSPPPSKAFSMPDRWAQLEPEAEQVNEATRQAVATARGAAAAAAAATTRRSNANRSDNDDMDNSNNSHISSRSSLHFEDEHEDESAFEVEQEDDSLRIRQEALRMLEVADDQLADSTYSVYRTKSGGFMASARTLGNQKRIPTALAGIATRAVSSVSATTTRGGGAKATVPAISAASSSSASRRRSTRDTTLLKSAVKRYRDDPTSSEDDGESLSSRSLANEKFSREDYEYGDERVVDVVGMEKRFASSRAGEELRNTSSTSKTASSSGSRSWSSRYSIDDTLLALSGGAQSGSKFLDKLDKENQERQRQTAQNMFAGSPHDARNTSVFGSGFSFRQQHVFGKQGVVAAPSSPNKDQKGETNLRTVWMDAVPNTPPVSTSSSGPARSWQEQLTLKRKQRRNYILAAFALLIFIITMSTILASHKSKQRDAADAAATATSAASDTTSMPPPNTNTADITEGSLTFYVTSDVPFDLAGEIRLMQDLDAVSKVAAFIVHLGNIQNATTTGCDPHRYGEVAEILEESPLTVFMIPGEEDWSNCPDQDEAWDAWYDNFVSFDEKFEPSFGVTRQYGYLENFAFVDSGVLFVGVHEVNGRMYDPEELRLRNQANLRWTVENGNRYQSGIRAMIILANGRPLLESNDDFYAPLGDFLYNFGVPTAYIHANDGNGEDEMMYKLFEYSGMEHVIAIQTSKGQTRSPLRINVGFSDTNPFIVG